MSSALDETGLSWGRISVGSGDPEQEAALKLFDMSTTMSTEAAAPSNDEGTNVDRRKTVDPQELLAFLENGRDKEDQADETVSIRRKSGRKTLDPREWSQLFDRGDDAFNTAPAMSASRRKTIDPLQMAEILASHDLTASSVRKLEQTPRGKGPSTPPPPPATGTKQIKSILRSSKKEQPSTMALGPRSVSFGRKRTVLSFDNRQPVINLTPAHKNVRKPIVTFEESPASHGNGSAQKTTSGLKKRPFNLRQITEEEVGDASSIDESGVDQNSPQQLSKRQAKLFSDEKKAVEEDEEGNGDQTMDVPAVNDFLSRGAEDGCDEGRGSSTSGFEDQTMEIASARDFIVSTDATNSNINQSHVQDDTRDDDKTMDIPNMMDFRRRSSVSGGMPQYASRDSITADIPTLSQFISEASSGDRGANSQQRPPRRETLGVPGILDFMTVPGEAETLQKDSSSRSSEPRQQQQNRRETLAIPSLSDFITENNNTENVQLHMRRESPGKRDMKSERIPRETLAIPNLSDFMTDDDPPPTTTTSSSNGDDADHPLRRLTLDIPSIGEFVNSEAPRSEKQNRDVSVPMQNFLHRQLESPEGIKPSASSNNSSMRPEQVSKPRTIGDAIQAFFPDREKASSPVKPNVAMRKSGGQIALFELESVTANDVAMALIGVHTDQCLSFCDEQLYHVAEQRATILTNKQLAMTLPQKVPSSTFPDLARAANLEAKTELNEWMNQVHSDYLASLKKQLARVADDAETVQRKLHTLNETREELEVKLSEAESSLELQDHVKVLKASVEKVQQRIASLTRKSKENENELALRRKQVEECTRRLDAMQTIQEPPLQEAESALERSLVQLGMQQSLSMWVLQNATLDSADIVFPSFTVHVSLESNRNGAHAFAVLRATGDGVNDYVRSLVNSKDDGRWQLFELSHLLNLLEQHLCDRLSVV